jgi:enoyl-CoA hydratase/carnithine racemase
VTETALGLALPNGAFQIARHAIPPARAREVLLGAGTYDPDGAKAVGLVDEVVELEALEARCLAQAARLGAHPSAAYGYQKYKLQAETNLAIREAPASGVERFRDAFLTPELFARVQPGKS